MAFQTWEYLVVPGEISQPALAELGRQGWELVAVTAGEHGATATATATAYLKRPALTFKERVTLEQRERYARLDGEHLGEGS